MAVNYLHGLETIELNDGLRPVQTIKSSVIGIVGTAPDADPALFPLNTPVALFADPIKANKLGAGGTLRDSVNAVYSQGSATVVVIRVTEGADLAHTWANVVGTVVAKTGAWALLKARPMLRLIPKILIAPGLTGARPSNGIVSANVGNGGAGYDQLTKVVFDAAPAAGRTAEGVVQVVGGEVTGLTITDPGFGYTAAPTATIVGAGAGATVTTTLGTVANPVGKVLEALAVRLRAVAFVDGPGTTYEAAISARSDFGSQRVMVIDPGVLVYDTAAAAYVNRPASGYAAGIQARVDKEKGFWYSFSNEEILNIGGPTRAVDFMYSDPDSEANQLNYNQVTTIIHDDGFRFWGLRNTGNDPLWAFMSVRRTADMIYESLEQAHRVFLDRPFNYALLDNIQNSVNAYLRQLRARGALINGTCMIDPTVNTKDTFVNGELIVDFDLEPPAPLEHLTFRARRNPNYYTDFIEEFASSVVA
ncbi:phage tail sheath subtilisin-like domain-containing protein [Methylobacterium sp. WL120]|uniref:phage tail sheath subtilisin-like domain-containing protein n=1 Tax=Methylobacterium sp. WL120 TaxID=2603887 RepID=UPI00164F479C|nr:phage tail sheath subtilisin-like domain-containing protein [Methylobacterium sp. WL120]